MDINVRKVLMPLLCAVFLAFSAAAAQADPVTFSTTGVFSVSGTNVVNFTNINGTTTITFNGTTNPVNTPAGTSFGDIVVTTTVPANLQGPAVAGTPYVWNLPGDWKNSEASSPRLQPPVVAPAQLTPLHYDCFCRREALRSRVVRLASHSPRSQSPTRAIGAARRPAADACFQYKRNALA